MATLTVAEQLGKLSCQLSKEYQWCLRAPVESLIYGMNMLLVCSAFEVQKC
jgi:hypothetical protein